MKIYCGKYLVNPVKILSILSKKLRALRVLHGKFLNTCFAFFDLFAALL